MMGVVTRMVAVTNGTLAQGMEGAVRRVLRSRWLEGRSRSIGCRFSKIGAPWPRRPSLSCWDPAFIRDPGGELLFSYRSGKSGSGDSYLLRYDESKGSWAPFHGAPLFKGN
jgi:hypothetical protein